MAQTGQTNLLKPSLKLKRKTICGHTKKEKRKRKKEKAKTGKRRKKIRP